MLENTSEHQIMKEKYRVSEMILEYVHAAIQRETYVADVFGFVEEENVDSSLAEGILLKADG